MCSVFILHYAGSDGSCHLLLIFWSLHPCLDSLEFALVLICRDCEHTGSWISGFSAGCSTWKSHTDILSKSRFRAFSPAIVAVAVVRVHCNQHSFELPFCGLPSLPSLTSATNKAVCHTKETRGIFSLPETLLVSE